MAETKGKNNMNKEYGNNIDLFLRDLATVKRNIDIIGIMRTGFYEAKNLYEIFSNPHYSASYSGKVRLIKFYPLSGGPILLNNEFDNPLHIESKDEERFETAQHIHDVRRGISRDQFLLNPLLRFIGKPQPENLPVLVDDFVYDGLTLADTVTALGTLGYDMRKGFFVQRESRIQGEYFIFNPLQSTEFFRSIRPRYKKLAKIYRKAIRNS